MSGTPKTGGAQGSRPLRVLVVDDEKNIRMTLSACLETMSCAVAQVASSRAVSAQPRRPQRSYGRVSGRIPKVAYRSGPALTAELCFAPKGVSDSLAGRRDPADCRLRGEARRQADAPGASQPRHGSRQRPGRLGSAMRYLCPRYRHHETPNAARIGASACAPSASGGEGVSRPR